MDIKNTILSVLAGLVIFVTLAVTGDIVNAEIGNLLSTHIYKVTPTGYVCGNTSPTANILEAQFVPDDTNHNLEVNVKRCSGGTFSKGGNAYVRVDNFKDYTYKASPTGYVCGTTSPTQGIVEFRLVPDNTNRDLNVRIRKCAGGSFSGSGNVYITVDGQTKWGPVSYSAGTSSISFDIDPIGGKSFTGRHTYQAAVYPTGQSYPILSGVVDSWEVYDSYTWGPIPYSAGTSFFSFDIDPIDDKGLSGSHQYQVHLYPTGQLDPIRTGNITAWNEAPPPVADLSIVNPSIQSAGPFFAGSSIAVQANVKNLGNSGSSGSHIGYWVANTANGNPINASYKHTTPVPSLSAGSQSGNLYEDVGIPVGLSSGNYYVIFETDTNSAINESNEANRISLPFTVQPCDKSVMYCDVPPNRTFRAEIEALRDKISNGCRSETNNNPYLTAVFCPETLADRASMAAFTVRRKLGMNPNLGSYKGYFADVPQTHPFALWIEKAKDLGITTGCGTNQQGQAIFCPDYDTSGESGLVTRANLALWMAKTEGWALSQPVAGDKFVDITQDSLWGRAAEYMYSKGIVGGAPQCKRTSPPAGTRYCSEDYADRGMAAAFMARSFGYVSLPVADLSIVNPSIQSAGPFFAGSSIAVQSNVKNLGNSGSSGSHIGYWVANTANGNPINASYKHTTPVPSLSAGSQSGNLYEDVGIPVGLSSGNYYIVFEADTNSAINESNEANRISLPFTVQSCDKSVMYCDVPPNRTFRAEIEALRDKISNGCRSETNGNIYQPAVFCPETLADRASMAAFTVRRKLGMNPNLEPYKGYFADVPQTHPFALWIEKAKDLGITTGCGTNQQGQALFCPDYDTSGESGLVTRANLALWMAKTEGWALSQPVAGDKFVDITQDSVWGRAAEYMYSKGIVGGAPQCKRTSPPIGRRYCSEDYADRGMAAAFMARSFGYVPVEPPGSCVSLVYSPNNVSWGTVSLESTSDSVRCPTDNSKWKVGSSIKLKATASSGYRLDHWEGVICDSPGCDIVNPITIGLDVNRNIVAHFVENSSSTEVYNTAFLTDAELEDYDSMTAQEIRAFLVSHNSYFRNNVTDVDGVTFDPSEIIYQAAQDHRINPKVILTTLEKESVGVTRNSRPSDTTMAFLMGCLSSSTARVQLTCAAERFRAYHNQIANNGVTASGWRVGVSKITVDSVIVSPATAAVAGQFTYTPYAGFQWGGSQSQWGGVYLFYYYWNKFGFGGTSPAIDCVSLSYNSNNSNWGTITLEETSNSVKCPTDNTKWQKGSSIVLKAISKVGYEFTSWQGVSCDSPNCEDNSRIAIGLDYDRNLVANFNEETTSGTVLDVRYVDQVYVQQQQENSYWNHCGPASLAMLLHHQNIETRDVLYDRQATLDLVCSVKEACKGASDKGKIRAVMISKGLTNSFIEFNPTIKQIKQSIDNGYPIIFSPTEANHILVISGYDTNDRVIVNDSYGEYSWWNYGYYANPNHRNTPASNVPKLLGKNVTYTYGKDIHARYAIFVGDAFSQQENIHATVNAQSGGSVVTDDILITFPKISYVTTGVEFRLTDVNSTSVVTLTSRYTSSHETHLDTIEIFEVMATDKNGQALQESSPAFDIRVNVNPSLLRNWQNTTGQTGAADTNEPHNNARFVLLAWDNMAVNWIEIPYILNEETGTLIASYNQFTEFVVGIKESSNVYVPIIVK